MAESLEGGCHCKSVRFRVVLPEKKLPLIVWRCNCSICYMKQNHHFILPRSAFTLLSGETNLTLYQFGTRTAKWLFCKTCGVQCFYIPRSNPDGVAVTLYCLDKAPERTPWIYKEYDGRGSWETAYKETGVGALSKM